MMHLLPTQLSLWGSPLYGELYIGLCRALAAPWLGAVQVDRLGGVAGNPSGAQQRFPAPGGWLLLDGEQSDGVPIEAPSLAELRRTVQDLRSFGEDLESEIASLAGEID